MKSVDEINKKLEYEKRKIEEFKNCSEGTDGHVRLKIAENIVSVLEWLLK